MEINKKGAKSLDITNPVFNKLVNYLENKVNKSGIEILKELEITSQIQEFQPNKRFKKYDINMANQKFKEIGLTGECLVNEYLEKKVLKGQLASYEWHNKNGESGLPYDFTLQDNRANIYYLDVKTTAFNFNQKMIFSSQEIEFISNYATNYCIYRVYKADDERYYLKICDDCKNLSSLIWKQTINYIDGLNEIEVELKSAKLAIPPNIPSLKFKTGIGIAIS